jgi:hypothetical protein
VCGRAYRARVLIPWFVFPLVLAALALGCGLLLEHASGSPLPGPLLLPAGLAAVMVAALFPPLFGSTASLATPLVVALAAAGYGLAWPFRRLRIDGWAAGSGVATYCIFAAPVVLLGRATFAGYLKLDDTATYLAMTDRYLGHGYDVSGLAASTYERTLATSLNTGYPMGSLMPLGVGHRLLGTDTAWLWQPYLAFLAVTVALGVYVLAEPLVRARPLRALAAVVAASAALLYGYALWGGIKEIAEAGLLVLVAALLPGFLRATGRRAALPLAVAAAATVGVQSAAGAVWLLVPAIAVGVVLARRTDLRGSLEAAAALVLGSLALSIPTLAAATMWLHHSGAFTSGTELGNLYHALNWSQIFGIWPVGDFRVSPGRGDVTGVLIAVVVIGAVLGLAVAWLRRGFGLLAYAGAALVGSSIFWLWGSPWIGGKALAIASPLFLALALAAAGWVFERGRRIEAVLAAAAILFGVGWSDVLAYHDAWLAPSSRLSELAAIGHDFAGDGPTLETDYDPYGARHFLRSMDAEGASELRVRPVALRAGGTPSRGSSPDLDEIDLPDVLLYRTLVIRRAPSTSRPPSIYQPVAEGRYYQVWQRPVSGFPLILEHLSLGNAFHAAAVPRCADVLRLARLAGTNGRLAAVLRPANVAVDLNGSPPGTPGSYGEAPALEYPQGAVTYPIVIEAPVAGIYDIGLDGSFLGRLELFAGTKRVGDARHELNWPSEYEPLASVRLSKGENRLTLRYDGPDLHPGSSWSGRTSPFGLGPLVVGRAEPDLPVTYVKPSRARTLCGKSLDWIEAVQPS